jgi:16S rRNA (cytosine967-C5)-methyltransferase
LYAVCSVLEEEGEGAVAWLVAGAGPSAERVRFEGEAARVLAGDAVSLLLLPHVHGTDGYYLASVRKKR